MLQFYGIKVNIFIGSHSTLTISTINLSNQKSHWIYSQGLLPHVAVCRPISGAAHPPRDTAQLGPASHPRSGDHSAQQHLEILFCEQELHLCCCLQTGRGSWKCSLPVRCFDSNVYMMACQPLITGTFSHSGAQIPRCCLRLGGREMKLSHGICGFVSEAGDMFSRKLVA